MRYYREPGASMLDLSCNATIETPFKTIKAELSGDALQKARIQTESSLNEHMGRHVS